MEKWQVDWITKQCVELQRNTRCTVRLLSGLQAKEILDWDEVTELDDEGNTAAKVKKFYSILMTKNCYDILTEELGNCRQTGAHQILLDGKVEHEKRMKAEAVKEGELERGPPREKKYAQGPEGVQDLLSSKENNVLLISTMDVDVTISKIRDNLDLPFEIAENRRHLRELMLDSESTKLFIFRCAEQPKSDFVEKVVSWTSSGAKAILLVKDGQFPSLENTVAFKTSRDILRWTELKYKFQEELLEKQVEIQVRGGRRSVKEILEEDSEEELEDEKLIINLINDNTPTLFRAFPDALSYYVQRKIRSRCVLNKDVIFDSGTSDIFLFTGIDIGTLSRHVYSCNHSTDNSYNQVNQLSVNYIILEHIDHFDKICEAGTGKGVHWVHHEGGKFVWIKSGNGSMERIQKAMENMKGENLMFSEGEFISDLDRRTEKYGNSPVLIADTPGMGKSTLLQSLGRQVLEKCADTKMVQLVAFSDLVKLLKAKIRKQKSEQVSQEMFEQTLLLLTTECGPELGKCVLKSMLRSSSNKNSNEIKVELMLDGYDEIYFDDLPLAKKVLTLIRDSYHSVRIWVATRPHLMQDLEDALHVVGFTILPYDESDQVNFLTKFWQSEKIKEEQGSISNSPNLLQDLVKFARYCLESVKQIWAKTSEEEDICGVPLQCLLIAKVYNDDCLSFANRGKLLTNSEPRLSLKVTSIKDLYDALIEKKFEIYEQRHQQLTREMKTEFLKIHCFFALQLLFPKHASRFEAALTSNSFNLKDIFNLGIVESAAGNLKDISPSFGHRTIPEFLVARFVAEQMCGNDDDCFAHEEIKPMEENNEKHEEPHQYSIRFTTYDLGNLLFDEILRTSSNQSNHVNLLQKLEYEKFENQTLAFFLESLLQGRSLDKSTRLDEIVAGRHRPITACIHGDHLHLFKALRCDYYRRMDKDILLVAVCFATTSFLEHICNEHNLILAECDATYYGPLIYDGTDTQIYLTLLHIALERREYSFIDFLLNCQGFGKLVKDSDPCMQDLVNTVLYNSGGDPEWLIKEKIQALRKLVELNRDVLETTTRFRCTVFFHYRRSVHVELILELLDLGENPFFDNEDNKTLLNTCDYLSGNDLHRVVTRLTAKLTEVQARELVNACAFIGGVSVLHVIARSIRQPTKELLEDLLKLGANFAAVTLNKQNCLHLAAYYGNVEAAKIFLELGMHALVNRKDWHGETVLDYLLLDNDVKTGRLEAFGELLISYGAKLSTDIGTTFLQIMSRTREGEIPLKVRFVLNHVPGADVNARDRWHNTPLHTCMKLYRRDTCQVAKFLLEKGADMTAKNNDGETPLQILLVRRPTAYLQKIETANALSLFLSKGASVETTKEAQAAFLLAIRGSTSMLYEDFEKLANSLVEKGAELRSESEGMTALFNECVEKELPNGLRYLVAKGVGVNSNHEGIPSEDFAWKNILQHKLENLNVLDSKGLTQLKRWLKRRGNLDLFLLFVAGNEEATPLKSEDATWILFKVAQYEGTLREMELFRVAQSKLLEAADVQNLDEKGENVLHYAAKRSYASLVRFFMEKGADINVRNGSGQIPLHCALSSIFRMEEQIVATLKELLSTETDIKAETREGKSIFDLSLEEHSAAALKYVLGTGHFDEFIRSDELLMKKVLSIKQVDKLRELHVRFVHVTGRSWQDVGRDSTHPDKGSLLHAAVEGGNHEIVAFLLEEKMFTFAHLSEMELIRFGNLLHVCIRNTLVLEKGEIKKRMSIVLKLVHHNKHLLNSKDAEGRTPLLTENVHMYLLRSLVELGADCNCVVQSGNSVDQLAANYLSKEDYDILAKVLSRMRNSVMDVNSSVASKDAPSA